MRDRDSIYGFAFRAQCKTLGIKEVRIARRSPWQNPFAERVIGSIRRECVDHVVPFNERHLLRTLREYVEYYNKSRTHMSLDGNAPVARCRSSGLGDVIANPVLAGLHHAYRRAA